MVVTLRCLEQTSPVFFHQPALTAFLRYLTHSPKDYSELIRIEVPESGRVRYEAGDFYRFTLIALAGGEQILDDLLGKLLLLPTSAVKKHPVLAFRDNWELAALTNPSTGAPVSCLEDVHHYDWHDLQQEVTEKHSPTEFSLRFLSPARILRERHQRVTQSGAKKKNIPRFIRDARDIYPTFLTTSIRNTIADLLRRRNQTTTALIDPPDASSCDSHLFWLDIHYADKKGNDTSMGGVCGRIDFCFDQPLSNTWWQLLVLGQYLGIGQFCSFGWGRYVLSAADHSSTYQPVFPANSILLKARDENVLEAAWRHVHSGKSTELPDDEDWLQWSPEAPVEQEEDCPTEAMQQAIDRMIAGSYKAPDLTGYLLEKKSGGVRPIAVAPAFDRILQRAVQQVLTPSIDSVLSHQSHGYRKGRSRITASAEIQRAWRDGYRWVYEGDVHDFFESVDLTRLQDRLSTIFGTDDPVTQILLEWMTATVVFEDQRIERSRGLPQGSPLSPLMANLMLDDFDSDMENAGFLIIRYADDFVILCKDPQEAKAAKVHAERSLEEHGLSLHPTKSAITAMQDGFRYLGYLFVNDMALDVSGARDATTNVVSTPPSQHSWLSKLADKQASQAQNQQTLGAMVERIVAQQITKLGTREESGTFVTVSGQVATISTLSGQLNVFRKDKRVIQLPWNSVECILLLGNHQITTQAMHTALQRDIPVHFASGTGRYKGCLTHNRSSQHQSLWMQQILSFQDSDKALYCARIVVGARLRHLKETLRQRKLAHSISSIDNALTKHNSAKSIQQLLGHEGSATREYFSKIQTILPEDLQFKGRNRRPPRDPFNVLLSIGYTQLYALTETVLHTQGLWPWQGFYHQPRGTHAVLASDLMEPFRHLVERSAIAMILREEINAGDFTYSKAGACYINAEAKRAFLTNLMKTWSLKVKSRGQHEPQTWLNHARTQAISLKMFITDGEPFAAFRIR